MVNCFYFMPGLTDIEKWRKGERRPEQKAGLKSHKCAIKEIQI